MSEEITFTCPKCSSNNTHEYALTRVVGDTDLEPWRCLDCQYMWTPLKDVVVEELPIEMLDEFLGIVCEKCTTWREDMDAWAASW